MPRDEAIRRDHWQEVTDRIVAALETGMPPWRKPWDSGAAAPTGPVNGVTGHQYRGINVLLLGSHPLAFESGDPRWCSYKQAQEQGWQVRRGERASTVFFFKRVEVADDNTKTDDTGNTKTVPMLRSYPVFHASQMDGVPAYAPPTPEEAPWRRPEAVDVILRNSGVAIRVGGDRAFYSPSTDHIQLPPDAAFSSREAWAATALHELGHATGHPSRLNRDLRNRFGSAAYAQEELRAELASAFLSAELGIPAALENHASYIDSWLKALKEDKREIFRAAADAQRAADWCLDRHPDYRAKVTRDADAEPPVSRQTAPPPVAASAAGPRQIAEAMPEHLRRRLYGPGTLSAPVTAPEPDVAWQAPRM